MNLANQLRYSPRPLSEYVRTVDGTRVGPGANLALVRSLAAWNVFFLSFPSLETFTDLHGGEPLWPHMDPLTPLVMETIRQGVGGAPVETFALYLTPDRFVAELRRRPHEHLALARFFKKGVWLDVMEARSALYVPEGIAEAQYVPGSVLTKQQDGTSGAVSTNILPLSRIFKLRLH